MRLGGSGRQLGTGEEFTLPDVANPGMEPSPTSRTHVNWGGLLVACSSGLALLAFLCRDVSSVVVGHRGSAMNEVAPGWTVGSKVLPNSKFTEQ